MLFFLWFYVCTMYVLAFLCLIAVCQFFNKRILLLPSQPKLVLIYRPRRNGRLSWPWVAGWLHTEINVRHRKLNPDTVAYLSTNWDRRRLTSLIKANVLTTTPGHQPLKVICFTCFLVSHYSNSRPLRYTTLQLFIVV